MKRILKAALLTCVATALSVPSTLLAQAAAPGACQMPDAEYQVYNNASTQTDPKAKAAAIESYLTQFPQSCAKSDTLVALMLAYVTANDSPHGITAADRVLQLDPSNLRALFYETFLHKAATDAITDPDPKKAAAAKQPELDQAASYAQKGLASPKPAATSDADFATLKAAAYPTFYSAIGFDAFNKGDFAGAIDTYKKEIAFVAADPKLAPQLQTPNPVLLDVYYLAGAYEQSTPPDYLDCAFYGARVVAFVPDNMKSQFSPVPKFCYKKYHGSDEGFDKLTQIATTNLNPPADLATTVTPAPTPAETIAKILKDTPPDQLATADKEYILQNGSPDEVATVWNSMKGKSFQFPDVVVISSTPTQVQVAISTATDPTPVADFTFNMAAPEAMADLPANATPAQKLAYKKKQAAADKEAATIAEATAVGKKVTLSGTFDSYTPKPFMITMTGGAVILPEAKPAPKAAPAAHHTPARRAH